MMRHFKTLAVVAAILGGGSSAAHAAAFDVSSAISDRTVHGGNNDHAVWLPFFESITGTPLNGNSNGSDFDFLPGARFVINDDGSAVLDGKIVSQVDARFGFDVSVNFTLLDGPGAGGPKKELRNCAYNGGCADVDTATFTYLTLTDGTFTGEGDFAGLNFSVTERPSNNFFPLQIGEGANGKNTELGGASWFFLSIIGGCDSQFCDSLAAFNTLRGDFNVNLVETPLPAGFLLFATGLAGLGLRRRTAPKQQSH